MIVTRNVKLGGKKGPNKFATLPTIAQCDMQGKIPPELDFNRLLAIKKASDSLYEELTKPICEE